MSIIRDGESVTYDRDGNILKRRFAKDGERVSIGMLMLDHGRKPAPVPTFDANRHRPHQLQRTDVDDAHSLGARQAYINRLNDGWRQGASSQLSHGTVALAQDDFDREQAAYNKSKQRLSNAWKDGGATRTDADAAYDRYRKRLEDGWKSPKSVA